MRLAGLADRIYKDAAAGLGNLIIYLTPQPLNLDSSKAWKAAVDYGFVD